MSDVPHPFAPFQPSPSIVPSKSGGSPEVTIEQPGKRPRKAKIAKKAADLKVDTVIKIPARKPARKPRGPNKPKAEKAARGPKLDLQMAMGLGASLKDLSEQAVFFKLHAVLAEQGKSARERIIAAIEKVFSR